MLSGFFIFIWADAGVPGRAGRLKVYPPQVLKAVGGGGDLCHTSLSPGFSPASPPPATQQRGGHKLWATAHLQQDPGAAPVTPPETVHSPGWGRGGVRAGVPRQNTQGAHNPFTQKKGALGACGRARSMTEPAVPGPALPRQLHSVRDKVTRSLASSGSSRAFSALCNEVRLTASSPSQTPAFHLGEEAITSQKPNPRVAWLSRAWLLPWPTPITAWLVLVCPCDHLALTGTGMGAFRGSGVSRAGPARSQFSIQRRVPPGRHHPVSPGLQRDGKQGERVSGGWTGRPMRGAPPGDCADQLSERVPVDTKAGLGGATCWGRGDTPGPKEQQCSEPWEPGSPPKDPGPWLSAIPSCPSAAESAKFVRLQHLLTLPCCASRASF